MPSISIELVPRSAQLLEEECLAVKAKFPTLEVANVPDILRMPLRSWEACRIAKRYFRRVIPYLRAIDFCLTEVGDLEEAIAELCSILFGSAFRFSLARVFHAHSHRYGHISCSHTWARQGAAANGRYAIHFMSRWFYKH